MHWRAENKVYKSATQEKLNVITAAKYLTSLKLCWADIK